MPNISQYISQWEGLIDNLDKEVAKIISKNEGQILSMIKLRLFNTGKKGDDTLLPSYAPSTKQLKQFKGQRKSHMTLRDTGAWYKGMFFKYEKGIFKSGSTDPKTPSLIRRYGEAILLPNSQEIEFIVNNIITPELENLISKKIGSEIDLGELFN